jgi:hypothetical protein
VNEGQLGTSYVGYERAFPQLPGMVLLDATADVDGVSKICPWRRHQPTPPERYDNLEIVQVPTVASGTLSRWLRDPEHRAIYVRHIQETVLEHVRPGQSALVVCKLDVVEVHPPIPGWSEHVGAVVRYMRLRGGLLIQINPRGAWEALVLDDSGLVLASSVAFPAEAAIPQKPYPQPGGRRDRDGAMSWVKGFGS